MSTTLFPARPGVVGIYYGVDALPVTVNIIRSDGLIWWAQTEIMRAILTGFELVGEGAVSTNLTLRQKIFTTVVGGEKPGALALSGLWFPGVCPLGEGFTGIDQMLAFYEFLRVSTTNQTVVVFIARTIYLVAVVKRFSARLADPSTGVGEWQLLLDYMPRKVLDQQPEVAELIGSLGSAAIAGAVR